MNVSESTFFTRFLDEILFNTQFHTKEQMSFIFNKLHTDYPTLLATLYLVSEDGDLHLYMNSPHLSAVPEQTEWARECLKIQREVHALRIPLILNGSMIGLWVLKEQELNVLSKIKEDDLKRMQFILSFMAGDILHDQWWTQRDREEEYFQQTMDMIGKFEKLTGLASKLVSAGTSHDIGFLRELLSVALAQIPEADYGSISIVDGDDWKFIDAVGHDLHTLQSLPLKKDYLIDIHEIKDYEVEGPIHIGIIHSYDDLHLKTLPDDLYEVFFKASKPMKSSMLIEYIVEDRILGTISIDIAKGSLKEFSTDSYRLFKAIGNLAFAMIAFMEFTKQEKEAKKKIEEWNIRLENLVEERTSQLSQTNQKMVSSMNYAKRIQESILPSEEVISQKFQESFLLWMPRDIVGGDFYWQKSIGHDSLIAIGDCTGHGVPGALMTMLSISLLNQVVELEGVKEPAEILRRLNILLKQTLHHNKQSITDDGLDIGICLVREEKSIAYAGAKCLLYISKNQEIQIIKGNKKSIGYRRTSMEYPFEQVEIPIHPDQIFYMLTDGYVDQNGGVNDFSFGRKRFEQILQLYYPFPLDEQRKLFLKELEGYMGDQPQRDDITLLGFKP